MKTDTKERVYHKVDSYDNLPSIRLENIGVFEEMLEKHNPEFIYVTKDKDGKGNDLIDRLRPESQRNEVTLFAYYHDGLVYTVNSMGYKSLADYNDGVTKGFQSGNNYYHAIENNYVDSEEYNKASQARFCGQSGVFKISKFGFCQCFRKITTGLYLRQIERTSLQKSKRPQ